MTQQNKINSRSPFAPRAKGYSISAKANEVDILLYDEIGFWGIQADAFIKDLNAVDAKIINLRINSPGGSVFDGTAIYNALKRHKAKIITHVDGLAASMASIIALAGSEVHMADNAFIMIHDPWSIAIGDAAVMRKEAEVLDKISDVMAKTYADKTGKSMEEIKQIMADETWFNATEAKEIGLVDSLDEKQDAKASFDLSIFNRVPEELKNLSGETPDKRSLEAALRDAGCSKKVAAAILSEGYGAIEQRDAVDNSEKALCEAISATTARIKSLIPA